MRCRAGFRFLSMCLRGIVQRMCAFIPDLRSARASRSACTVAGTAFLMLHNCNPDAIRRDIKAGRKKGNRWSEHTLSEPDSPEAAWQIFPKHDRLESRSCVVQPTPTNILHPRDKENLIYNVSPQPAPDLAGTMRSISSHVIVVHIMFSSRFRPT